MMLSREVVSGVDAGQTRPSAHRPCVVHRVRMMGGRVVRVVTQADEDLALVLAQMTRAREEAETGEEGDPFLWW